MAARSSDTQMDVSRTFVRYTGGWRTVCEGLWFIGRFVTWPTEPLPGHSIVIYIDGTGLVYEITQHGDVNPQPHHVVANGVIVTVTNTGSDYVTIVQMPMLLSREVRDFRELRDALYLLCRREVDIELDYTQNGRVMVIIQNEGDDIQSINYYDNMVDAERAAGATDMRVIMAQYGTISYNVRIYNNGIRID